MQEFTRRSLLQAASASAVAAGWGTVAKAEETDLAAAKREGRLSWYCSVPIEHAQKVAKMFEAQTGIRVEMFRSGGMQVLNRFLQEKKAGRIVVDVLNNGDIASSRALAQSGNFVPFKPKNFERVWEGARDSQGSFFGERLNMRRSSLGRTKCWKRTGRERGPICSIRNTRAS